MSTEEAEAAESEAAAERFAIAAKKIKVLTSMLTICAVHSCPPEMAVIEAIIADYKGDCPKCEETLIPRYCPNCAEFR